MTTHFSGPVQVGGGIIGAGGGGGGVLKAPGGRTFFVNTNTSGDRNKDRPWYDVDEVEVFSTMQLAIDACVADRGDVIYVARGYQNPSATVNFNKQGIIVIGQGFGMNPKSLGEFSTIDTSNTDGPAARITAGCVIMGLGFVGAQATGDDFTATMQLDGSGGATDGFGTWLIGCRFTNWNKAGVNFGIVNKGVASCTVQDSIFAGGAAANVLDAGILHDESTTAGGGRPGELDVINCRFEHCTYAMEVVSGSRVVNCMWRDNVMGFNAPADAWVKFLKLNVLGGGGAVHGAIVAGNRFATGVNTGTFSHSLSDLVTEGYQFSGNTYGTDLSQLA